MTKTTSKKTYKIVRMFARDTSNNKTLATGLTLKEAQAHCKDPETSSSTARGLDQIFLTRSLGPWFDGYEEERHQID